jgi:hypothetical protein
MVGLVDLPITSPPPPFTALFLLGVRKGDLGVKEGGTPAKGEGPISFGRSGVVRPFLLPEVVFVLLLPPDPSSLGLTDLTVGRMGDGGLHRFRPVGVTGLVGEVERCIKLGTEEAAREVVPYPYGPDRVSECPELFLH